MNTVLDLSVVIPVYNNAATISELLTRIMALCDTHDLTYEILCINDGSIDHSKQIMQQFSSTHPGIQHIAHASNKGQAEAIRTGLKLVNGKHIAILDADLQDTPEYLVDLYDALLQHDVAAVFAVRSNNYQMGHRMLTSRLFKWLMRMLVGLPTGAGGYVVITQKMAQAILNYDTAHFYLAGLICKTKLPLYYINCPRQYRKIGQSQYSYYKRLKVAYCNFLCLLESMRS